MDITDEMRRHSAAHLTARAVCNLFPGTQTDIGAYHFDYRALSGPDISIKNPDTAEKKVIIAEPLDRIPFQGE